MPLMSKIKEINTALALQALAAVGIHAAVDPIDVALYFVMDEAVMMPAVYDRALNYRNPRLANVYVTDYYGMIDFGSLGIE
jgi:peptide/nickel transport system substrate-binding protein